MVKILPMSHDAWAEALLALRSGEIAAFPTDTVYGVGCDPWDPLAIERLYSAKGRSREKAIPILLSDPARLKDVALTPSQNALVLAQRFWPGALTLVVPRLPELPETLSGGPTVAVRVPDHEDLLNFIRQFGGAIAATSANLSGLPDARTAAEAAEYLSESVALVVDGGRTRGASPSTVVDCTVNPVRILREGPVSAAAIHDVLASQRDDA